LLLLLLSTVWVLVGGRDSSVGIATRYGLDGKGIESRWWWDFPHPSRPALGVPGPPRIKRQGRGVHHPPPFSAEVKERAQLYLYSPSGHSWPVLGWTLPLPLPFIGIGRRDHCNGLLSSIWPGNRQVMMMMMMMMMMMIMMHTSVSV
jgi:hypothetical protein